MHQTVVAVLIERGIGTIHLTQSPQHIVGYLFARCGRHPGVEIDAVCGVSLMLVVMVGLEQSDAVGAIHHHKIWCVVDEFLQTGLLKTKGSDAEISFAIACLHHLLRREFVSFGTCSCWYKGVDLEIVSSNGLHKIAQGLDAHGEDGTSVDNIVTPHQNEGENEEKYIAKC